MKRKCLLSNRQDLIRFLEQEIGTISVYTGAPSFRYYVGDYSVLRDGTLEVDDDKADLHLINRMRELGMIEDDSPATHVQKNSFAFPADSFTGVALTNLVKQIYTKESLLNKAIGVPDAFHVEEKLILELRSKRGLSRQEFMQVLDECGGAHTIKGLTIDGVQVVFTGFPDKRIFHQLAECMVDSARRHKWMKFSAVATVSEKYTFRTWLMAIGMKGPEYKEARWELLLPLTGPEDYRTEKQKQAYQERLRKKKEEMDFIPL